ncbi:MAG TPA: extracellular solute-binding protein [Patescibacteria group bacterium]
MAALDPNMPNPSVTPMPTENPSVPNQTIGQVPVGQSFMPVSGQTPMPPPPLPQQPPTPTTSQEVVGMGNTDGGRKGIPKILLIVVGAVILIGILAFIAMKFIVPGVSKSGPVTLTWWGLWEDEATVSPIIAEYNQQHPNVKIQYVKQSKEDYRERLTNTLAKGAGAPDIFTYHNSWVPMFKNDLDILPSTVMTAQEYSQTFFSIANSDLRTQNGIVGIPLGIDTLALFVNDDIFTAYGKPVPKTWDDLRQAALDLTVRDANGNIQQAGVALGRTENVDNWQEILALMMLQNGVKLSDMTPVDRASTALTYYTLFAGTDHVWDETLPPSTVAFATGKLAMYFGPSWRVFEIKQQNPNLKFSVVAVPQLPKDNPAQPNVTYATYWAQGVSAKSTAKEAAWDFLKFISTKDSLQKIYQTAAQARQYGEPYPRVDMATLLSSDKIFGAFVSQAPDSQSWYLDSRTFDGATGINSQIGKYFEDAINSMNKGTDVARVISTLTPGISQVLSTYGLAPAPAATQP